jgi:hypothetical protein
MLTAYWDLGLQIKNLPTDDIRAPQFPFDNLESAKSLLAKAKVARPEVDWVIEEKNGSYSVRERLS